LATTALNDLLEKVRIDGVASDLAVNGQGVRRHAIALPHLDGRLAGALVVAQTDGAQSLTVIRDALLVWRARLAVTQD
jgi:DNA-binding IclR family transcriptional regulator